MDGRFLDAFTLLPRQRVICGYETRPISLRHRLVLKQIGSPFSEGGVVPTPQDVIIAAKVLSFGTLEDMLQSKPTEEDIQWVKDMTDNPELLLDQCSLVALCIEEQARWPIFWNKSKSGSDHGVPWVLNIVCNLVKNGVPLEDAWTMPESQAVWLHATFCILNGSETDIVSEQDRKAMEQLRELEDKMKKDPSMAPKHPRSPKDRKGDK